MLPQVLIASLGDYGHIGFTLKELDDGSIELRFMGKLVNVFNKNDTVALIRYSCQEYLRVHEYGNCN